jgi:transposase-like protein
MPQCPDCQSNSVQSKGYRIAGVHRYLCNKCGRNFTIDNRPKIELPTKIQEEVNMIEQEVKAEQEIKTESKGKNKTIAVSEDIHEWLESMKRIKQETFTSVLDRIRSELKNKTIDETYYIK